MRKQQAPAAPTVTIDTIIDHVSRDKGIDRRVLIEAVECYESTPVKPNF